MTTQTLTYPRFTPGAGRAPPYLAGRAREQVILQNMLADLRQGDGAPGDVVIIGPRGNGKTVLARWFENECDRDNALDVVWLTPDEIADVDELARYLIPPKRWKSFLPSEAGLDIKGAQLKWRLNDTPSGLTDLLTARCRGRALALVVDEAHTLDPVLGRFLLNASQKVRAKAPFLLILVGTPGLEYRLNEMSATFWSRAKKLGLGRLDEEDACAALVRPLAEHGIEVDGAALAAVVDESQRYPYFLQCWGEALTAVLRDREAVSGRRQQVNQDLVARALPAFTEERIAHYAIFRDQISDAGLQSLAAAVTRAFGDADTLTQDRLNAAVRMALQAGQPDGVAPTKADVIKHRKALAGFGYVWRPLGSNDTWHAGVPSLMRNVLEMEEREEALSTAEEEPERIKGQI